mmetsp:Transcript_36657/g.112956  ORF Transcript_36657/g.112956 Transcript_36657/m.112956 type:complete len:343 (-) Transcript_36657:18-1046(-)
MRLGKLCVVVLYQKHGCRDADAKVSACGTWPPRRLSHDAAKLSEEQRQQVLERRLGVAKQRAELRRAERVRRVDDGLDDAHPGVGGVAGQLGVLGLEARHGGVEGDGLLRGRVRDALGLLQRHLHVLQGRLDVLIGGAGHRLASRRGDRGGGAAVREGGANARAGVRGGRRRGFRSTRRDFSEGDTSLGAGAGRRGVGGCRCVDRHMLRRVRARRWSGDGGCLGGPRVDRGQGPGVRRRHAVVVLDGGGVAGGTSGGGGGFAWLGAEAEVHVEATKRTSVRRSRIRVRLRTSGTGVRRAARRHGEEVVVERVHGKKRLGDLDEMGVCCEGNRKRTKCKQKLQ